MSNASTSKMTVVALQTMGHLIKSTRNLRNMPQHDLAERLNVSRYTIMALEKGSPTVAIGVAFEAAHILGIPLLADDNIALHAMHRNLVNINSVLPKKVHKSPDLDDDF